MRQLLEIDLQNYENCDSVFSRPSVRGIILKDDNKIALVYSEKDSEFLKNNNYTKEEVMSGFKQLLMQSGYTDLLCLVKAEE